MNHQFYLFARNLCIVLGAMFFLIFFNPIVRFISTSNWPQAEGVVTTSQWTSKKSLFMTTYEIVVTFDYRVDSQTYQGNRINYGIAANAYLFEEFAKRVVARYPIGKTIPVYYNPNNPKDEIVERSPMGGFSVVWIFLTLSCFVAAIVVTTHRNNLKNKIDRPKEGSLRLRGQQGEEIFKDDYPSSIYNPPAQGMTQKKP